MLITGVAGFIGFSAAKRFLADSDWEILGIDNLNPYYDPRLKAKRLEILSPFPKFKFEKLDIVERHGLFEALKTFRPTRVLHLAAQAGVRYSLENPYAYSSSNLDGFLNILEGCRNLSVEHLVFASSSSVYGANTKMPFSEKDPVSHPLSLYAATKLANEAMAHSYASLYGLPCTGLRFFTVYGPWGRPDMALFKFTRAIIEGENLDVYNEGNHRRDFTYVDDIVEGLVRILKNGPAVADASWNSQAPDPSTSFAPYRLYNIGRGQPEDLMEFIRIIEKTLGKKAKINFLPKQPGDVVETSADVSSLERDFGYRPQVSVRDGVSRFVEWYTEIYLPLSKAS